MGSLFFLVTPLFLWSYGPLLITAFPGPVLYLFSVFVGVDSLILVGRLLHIGLFDSIWILSSKGNDQKWQRTKHECLNSGDQTNEHSSMGIL